MFQSISTASISFLIFLYWVKAELDFFVRESSSPSVSGTSFLWVISKKFASINFLQVLPYWSSFGFNNSLFALSIISISKLFASFKKSCLMGSLKIILFLTSCQIISWRVILSSLTSSGSFKQLTWSFNCFLISFSFLKLASYFDWSNASILAFILDFMLWITFPFDFPCASKVKCPKDLSSSLFRTTCRAARLSAAKSIFLSFSSKAPMIFVIVWLLPVPGGPCTIKFFPSKALIITLYWVLSASAINFGTVFEFWFISSLSCLISILPKGSISDDGIPLMKSLSNSFSSRGLTSQQFASFWLKKFVSHQIEIFLKEKLLMVE